MNDLFNRGSAEFSPCGRYRYHLVRSWLGGRGSVCWVMLNPSTADGKTDDPTVQRIVGFSKRWGYNELQVVNLFAWRATHPSELARQMSTGMDVHGEPRAGIVRTVAVTSADLVVAAWGNPPSPAFKDIMRRARALIGGAIGFPRGGGNQLHHLGLTREGYPTHPLARGKSRVPDERMPLVWTI